MLIGKRIELRPPTRGDAGLLAGWYNDPDFYGDWHNIWPTSVEAVEESIVRGRQADDRELYLVVDRASGVEVGIVAYSFPHAPSYRAMFTDYEVWYYVHPAHRRQGYASEAAALLVNHLFLSLPLPRLSGFVVAGNEASCRVMAKIGMRPEGRWRRIMHLHGGWADMLLFGITREEWGGEAAYRQGRDF